MAEKSRRKLDSLNPLNQVYVFNAMILQEKLEAPEGLNPLNQVYVFNRRAAAGSTRSITTSRK